jgi:hypothetical protein
VKCDANIAAKAGTTSCVFAENVFYEYWSSQSVTTLQAYSPTTHEAYDVICTAGAGVVTCTTADGGAVRFSQAAVDAYSQAQADAYAASHDLGP